MKNQKGFSLVELMLAVGIIGLLAAVAIPTIKGHQNKAKQTEARIALASLYKAQQIFYAETKTFYMNLVAVGYAPEGVLNYRVGFGTDHSAIIEPEDYSIGNMKKDLGADSLDICQLDFNQGSFNGVSNKCKHTAKSSVGLEPDNSWKATGSTFILGAKGHLKGNKPDIWTMDNSKNMMHAQNGAE